jgi:hypothetical protein
MANPRLHENKFKRAFVVPFRGVVRKLSPVNYVKYQYKYITHHPSTSRTRNATPRSFNSFAFSSIPMTLKPSSAPAASPSAIT